MRKAQLIGVSLVLFSTGTCIAACLENDECLLDYDCPGRVQVRGCRDGSGADAVCPGLACVHDGDCAGGECDHGTCKSNCHDGVRNNEELDIDCGPGCSPCAQGRTCLDNDGVERAEHCATGFCVDGVCCDAACEGPRCQGASRVERGHCDGKGRCIEGESIPCTPYACVGTTCLETCSSDDDCAGGHYCATSTCSPKKDIGKECSRAQECKGGLCVDGFCCDTACADKCSACSKAKNQGANGLCGPVKNGSDPDNECDGLATCNGAGICTPMAVAAKCDADIECTSGHCTDGVCCYDACAEPCHACSIAVKQQGYDGICGYIKNGIDPHNDCKGAGVCNGQGVCM